VSKTTEDEAPPNSLAGAVAAGPVNRIGRRKARAGPRRKNSACRAPPSRRSRKPRATRSPQPSLKKLVTSNKSRPSDFMVDCLKALNIDYCSRPVPVRHSAAMQESIINYGHELQARVHHLHA